MRSSTLLPAVLAALACPTTVLSHPHHSTPPRSDAGHKYDARNMHARADISSFAMPLTGSYVGGRSAADSPHSRLAKRGTYTDTAEAFVRMTAPNATFVMAKDYYVGTNGVGHVHFKQTLNGVTVDNGNFKVNINTKTGDVLSYTNDFYSGQSPPATKLKTRAYSDPIAALNILTNSLGLNVDGSKGNAESKYGSASLTGGGDSTEVYIRNTTGTLVDPEAKLVYLQKADGSVGLTWRLETQMQYSWLTSYVNGEEEKVEGVVDYVNSLASYKVYPFNLNDPSEGQAETIQDPWSDSSRYTWHGVDGHGAYRVAAGNNAVAGFNPENTVEYTDLYRPRSETREFVYDDYVPDGTDTRQFLDQSITQLFYTVNMYHDLLYSLGFNEDAGNFEYNNGDKAGVGGDFVILDALSSLDVLDANGNPTRNNALFSTPPDGSPGRMQVFMWDAGGGMRDGAFDRGIIVHEYTHGLSMRLTGGPADTTCLSAVESMGMGEGWSDTMANAVRVKASMTRDDDLVLGAWAFNNAAGIRDRPYSTSMERNEHTYKSVDGITAQHQIGTVWASILYECMWNVIDKAGMNDDNGWNVQLDDKGLPTDGRFLFMKMVMDGLALQPCNPNFVDSRNAILDADTQLTGGAYQCELWTGFAKRGLGDGAVFDEAGRTESNTIPAGVCP